VGHSTRPIEAFTALLSGHQVTQLIDVRTVPRSRHNPQYNEDALAAALAAGIGYARASGLGGFRRPTADSVNAGWRNLSFRGYADYMQTDDFAANLASVIDACPNRPCRHDVRGSGTVALPPIADCRRTGRSRRAGVRDRRAGTVATTPADAVRLRAGRTDHLSPGSRRRPLSLVATANTPATISA
jgi:hypothetical protein